MSYNRKVQEFIIIKDPTIKRKLRKAAVSQEYIEKAPVLIMVCSNTSRSISHYGSQCKELYSIIEGIFASILILLIAVNDEIGACFVGAFEDNKLSAIPELQVC